MMVTGVTETSSIALAVIFIIRLFSTSALRVPKLIGGHFGSGTKVLLKRAMQAVRLKQELTKKSTDKRLSKGS